MWYWSSGFTNEKTNSGKLSTSSQISEQFSSRACAWSVNCKCQGSCVHAKSLQSCPTLRIPTDDRLTVSSVHGILQARILEWVVVISSRGSSQPQGWNPCLLGLLHRQAGSSPAVPCYARWLPELNSQKKQNRALKSKKRLLNWCSGLRDNPVKTE